MPNELTIAQAELRDDPSNQMTLEVQLHNSSNRTLHACASIRALRYDPATRTLQIQLSDRNLTEMPPSGNFLLPEFMPVDPNSTATLSLSVPRTIARLKPGQNMVAPEVEELPAHEAEYVGIEVAYSGTPFYRDPRPKTGTPRQMMVDRAEGYVQNSFTVRPTQPGTKA